MLKVLGFDLVRHEVHHLLTEFLQWCFNLLLFLAAQGGFLHGEFLEEEMLRERAELSDELFFGKR